MGGSYLPLFLPSKGHSKKKKWGILGLLCLLALSFMGVFVPVHASSIVSHTAAVAYTTIANVGIALTVSQPGDLVTVNIQPYNLDGAATSMTVLTVTDSFGNIYTNVVSHAQNSGAACSTGGGTCHDDEIWAVSSSAAGADTITITFSDVSTSGNAEAIDVVGSTSGVSGTGVGSCSFGSGCSLAFSGQLFNPNTAGLPFNAGSDFVDVSLYTPCQAASVVTAGTGFTLVSPASIFNGLAEYAGSTSVSPTVFPASCGTSNQWTDIGVVFIGGGVTTTTTVNTLCTGACSGGQNTTGNYLIRNQLYFYSSQNVATTATIDNVTLKFGTVKMNVTVGSLYISIYTATGVPAAGNPWIQVPGPTGSFTIPIFNVTSSNTFVHLNPQTQIVSGQYYAVGVMASPEGHSRGGGSANSGVQLLETSQSGLTEFSYAAVGPSGTAHVPPTTFFSSTAFTPHHFIYIHSIFPVVIFTATSTSILTVGGTATTTVTIKSTTLDLSLAVTSMTTLVIDTLIILVFAFAMFVPIAFYTHNATMALLAFVIGMMIGSGIGVYAGLVPPVFMGLSVIIGVLVVVGISRSGGGEV